MQEEDYFEHLGHADLDAPGQTRVKAESMIRHSCEHCDGTGIWNYGAGKCHACKGKGYFKTSARARAKTRHTVATSRAKKLAEAQSQFHHANDGLLSELRGMTDWNEFAESLVSQFEKRGDLTVRQIDAANRMIAKTHATRAAKIASAPTVDLSAISAMFRTALDSGLRRPKYRALGLVISLAPESGVNAGALYVKTDYNAYRGKITVDHVYRAVDDHDGRVAKSLAEIAKNPKEVAANYGKLYGECSCCGRTLTDPVSVENGIGPICATHFGF